MYKFYAVRYKRSPLFMSHPSPCTYKSTFFMKWAQKFPALPQIISMVHIPSFRNGFSQILSFLYRASFQHKKWKTNWCHCFNFIHISTDLYMFRAHRPIFRRIHTAVPTTIGSVSVPFRSRVQYVFHFLCWKDARYKKLKIYKSTYSI